MKTRARVLLMFSGGRDSCLSCCHLIEQGFDVALVHFDNGKAIGTENVEVSANRLRQMYGEAVSYLGVESISGIWREFFLPYMSMQPSAVAETWGELPFSQFCCLTCRSAMYVWAILYCRATGITRIAEGAREAQNWPMMQSTMIERFRRLLSHYEIELLLPVQHVKTNWERKNALLRRGFLPKVLEPQCLLGVDLPFATSPPERVQEAVERFYDTVVEPRAHEIVVHEQPAFLTERAVQNALL